MSAEWSEQPASGADAGNPGVTLAAQREAMGWTVEQVAEQLKLAPRQVLALEQGDFAALPNAAVVRGFVRAYAKVVKLDAAPLVAMIALDVPETSNDSAARRDKPATFTAVRFPSASKRRLPLGLLAGAVLLLVAAAGAYRFELIPRTWLARADKAPAVTAPVAASAPVASLQPATSPAASAGDGVAPPLSATTAAPASDAASAATDAAVTPSVPLISVPPAPVAAASAPVTAAASAPVTAPPAAAAGANQLVLVVKQDSWVEIRRFKGAPLIKREVKAGNTETFDVADASFMIIGNPHGVIATLRGAPLELKPIPGGKISRVNFKSAP